MSSGQPGVHLVGSVPLPDSEAVFRTVARELGPHLRRIPDGETGERGRWIWWQRQMLEGHPAMEVDPDVEPFKLHQWDGQLLRETPLLRIKSKMDPASLRFDTDYGRAAKDSYQVYSRLKDEGIIPAGTLFQISLPTPMAPAYMYVSPSSRDGFLPAYEQALGRALADILSLIPLSELSIQWDVCQEVLIFEDYFQERPPDYKRQVFDELSRLGQLVPEGVDWATIFATAALATSTW